jgi:hypothetical protein
VLDKEGSMNREPPHDKMHRFCPQSFATNNEGQCTSRSTTAYAIHHIMWDFHPFDIDYSTSVYIMSVCGGLPIMR